MIPNDILEEPTITEMAKLDWNFPYLGRRAVLGLSSTVVLQRSHAFLLTYYSDDSQKIMLGDEFIKKIHDEDDSARQIYDETTGRIVALSLFRGNIVLCDVCGRC